jgi:hypothetical protein
MDRREGNEKLNPGELVWRRIGVLRVSVVFSAFVPPWGCGLTRTLLRLVQKNFKLHGKVPSHCGLQSPLILDRCAHSRNQFFEALNGALKVVDIFLQQSKEFCVGSGDKTPPDPIEQPAEMIAILLPSHTGSGQTAKECRIFRELASFLLFRRAYRFSLGRTWTRVSSCECV